MEAITSSHYNPFESLKLKIKIWAKELGFQAIGVTKPAISDKDQQHFLQWLEQKMHGGLNYMERHKELRLNPKQLHPSVMRIISVRMDYLPSNTKSIKILGNKDKAYISRYALGRDYHKVIRMRLKQLGKKIEEACGNHDYRAFVDSAPIMERPLARDAGLGWMGKHSLIINPKAGSFFFLGELFTNLPLPIDPPFDKSHCGSCQSCIDLCPTRAIVAPYKVDARRCISYLTIEYKGSIPVELRSLMGNRVFGCDDCQLACPWNKFSKPSDESDFQPRHQLAYSDLATLFLWSEEEFKERTAGSAIRRAGFESWLRNIAVGLGNAPTSSKTLTALKARADHSSVLVKEHVNWALEQHRLRDAGIFPR
ncbi:MAG: tRNA epoxyqueuosine(34) reductase QueG [Candidatus Endonucleobacter bathymodioli]|uniref:Epoxyqueuosine reductase n=1 Tax=Candidatus Endonucleibacter bathymodioli TaxID=539814 RepID=A0AA90SZ13_9GAMM|nr:tRNA epoxyqueuosine(34) reductase QueG [Candidatus Endonucleobacter bathymodioli]